MRFDSGLVTRHSQEDLGNSVADIVFHEKSENQEGTKHTDTRINEIQIIVPRGIKPVREQILDPMNKRLQKNSSKTAAYTDSESKHKKLVLFRHIPKFIPQRGQVSFHHFHKTHIPYKHT